MSMQSLMRVARFAWFHVVLALAAVPAFAQEEAMPDVMPSAERPLTLTNDEARAALATPVPESAPAAERLRLLIRQRTAARLLGEESEMIRVMHQLFELGRGNPEWSRWAVDLLNAEYTFGSQQKSFEIGEAVLAAPDLTPEFRATTAARLAWMYCDAGDRQNCERTFAKAESAYASLPADVNELRRAFVHVQDLEARSQLMRLRGDLDADVAALRQAAVESRRNVDRVAATVSGDRQSAAYRGAVLAAEYAAGQLVYGLLRQGRSTEALTVAEEGLARARLDKLTPDAIGGWHHRLAFALLSQRRYEEALASARSSIDELKAAGGSNLSQQINLARTAEIFALVSLERWADADASYSAWLQELRADKAAYDRAYEARLAAILAAKNNRIDVALSTIEQSYRFRVRVFGTKHPYTQETRGVRGAINLINNAPGAAMDDYDDFFTALLDTPSGWVDLEPSGRRAQYLNITLDEFLRYAATQYQSGGQNALDKRVFERLVQVTDRLASGAAQRAIFESSAKLRTGNPALVEMLDREQVQRRELRDAYRAISDVLTQEAKATSDDQRKALRAKLKAEREVAESAQRQLDALRQELASKFPGFVALVNPVYPNLDTVRKALAANEAFVEIYPSRQGTFVWGVNANGKQALHVSRWTGAEVAKRVAAMRATLDVGDRLPSLPPMNFAPGLEIYNELIRPMRPVLEGATVVNVAAGDALASIPLAALTTGDAQDVKSAPWLGREFAIAEVPGSAAFVALRTNAARSVAAKPFEGFGDPDFGRSGAAPVRTAKTSEKAASIAPSRDSAAKRGVRNLVVAANAAQASTYSLENGFRYASMPPLPETRDELAALATALGADASRDVVVGAEASRKTVLATPLADRRVVAFATHGLMPGEIPGLSKPALAMAATDDPNDSPLLTLDDVLTLKLDSQWVVLSACNTAGGERDGAAMSGLVRGFFFAGTRSVLATYWAVESQASKELVTAIFADYAKAPKGGRAASVRRAQLGMIDGTIGDGRYAHPFYWAAYGLFGDPAR